MKILLFTSRLVVSAASFVAIGCGEDDATSDVKGTILYTSHTDTGDVDVPAEPDEEHVAAHILQPDGRFSKRTGYIYGDGSFVIPDIPPGLFYIQYDGGYYYSVPTYVLTSERDLDLGSYRMGRPELSSMELGASLLLNVDGLNPWSDTDTLELYSLGAPAYYRGHAITDTPPLVGDTSLTGRVVPSDEHLPSGYINGEKGDVAYVTQGIGRTTNGFSYSSVGKVFKPASFTLEDGGTTELHGSFEAVPQNKVTLDWKRSSFKELVEEARSAVLLRTQLAIRAEPRGASARAWVAPAVASGWSDDASDSLVELSYGNPYPSGWDLLVVLSMDSKVVYPFEEYPGGCEWHGMVSVAAPLDAFSSSPLEPSLGPVQDIQMNGESADGELAGVGPTPKVSFSAPRVGAPTMYIVTIFSLNPTSFNAHPVAIIHTKETSLTVPPDILAEGVSYMLEITAVTDVNIEAPFKVGAGARTPMVTAMFTR